MMMGLATNDIPEAVSKLKMIDSSLYNVIARRYDEAIHCLNPAQEH